MARNGVFTRLCAFCPYGLDNLGRKLRAPPSLSAIASLCGGSALGWRSDLPDFVLVTRFNLNDAVVK